MKNILCLSRDIYEGNKARGFWPPNRNKGEVLALVHTEVTEAFECLIDMSPGLLSEQPQPKCDYPLVVEELADIAIRLCDYLYGFRILMMTPEGNLVIPEDVPDHCLDPREVFQATQGVSNHDIMNGLMIINMYVSHAVEDLRKDRNEFDNLYFALWSVMTVCNMYGFGLEDVMNAKMDYNATRAAKHGKKF